MDAVDKLVHMANQIAAFFRPYPEAEAVAGIHDHMVAFWTPAMRRDLAGRIARDGTGVDPLVTAAVSVPGSGPTPAWKEAAGPKDLGQVGASDAG